MNHSFRYKVRQPVQKWNDAFRNNRMCSGHYDIKFITDHCLSPDYHNRPIKTILLKEDSGNGFIKFVYIISNYIFMLGKNKFDRLCHSPLYQLIWSGYEKEKMSSLFYSRIGNWHFEYAFITLLQLIY